MSSGLLDIYNRLYRHFGPQNWWPADGPFEVVIGAILTQNTAWPNVERAIANLKRHNLLTPERLYRLDIKKLARLIRPSGYYNIKAGRIKAFLDFLFGKYNGSLKKLFSKKSAQLRKELLGVCGIGPETADSIMLYAADKPVFVVDAYTKRIFSRRGMVRKDAVYADIQKFFTDNLPRSRRLFNEYHALIVGLGKSVCRTKPRCDICPIACSVK